MFRFFASPSPILRVTHPASGNRDKDNNNKKKQLISLTTE